MFSVLRLIMANTSLPNNDESQENQGGAEPLTRGISHLILSRSPFFNILANVELNT